MVEFLVSKEVQKAATITVLGMFAASAVLGIKNAQAIANHFAPSPKEILAAATAAFTESGATPEQCFPAVMQSGGVIGDLVAEVQQNNELDINRIQGFTDAGDEINNVLAAMHEISNSDHHNIVQIGDQYSYCVLEDGTIIPGNPATYVIVTR